MKVRVAAVKNQMVSIMQALKDYKRKDTHKKTKELHS